MAVISSWSTSLPLLLLLRPVAALNSISFSPLITSHTHTNDRASAVTICPHDTTQLFSDHSMTPAAARALVPAAIGRYMPPAPELLLLAIDRRVVVGV